MAGKTSAFAKTSMFKKMTGELWLLVGANAACIGLAGVYTWHTWISHPETTINKSANRYPYLIQRKEAKNNTSH